MANFHPITNVAVAPSPIMDGIVSAFNSPVIPPPGDRFGHPLGEVPILPLPGSFGGTSSAPI